MTKFTFSDIATLTNAPEAINGIVTEIEEALDTLVSRDGAAPNQMTANLDMNSKRILNLPAPASSTEPVTLSYFQATVQSADAQEAADEAAASAAAALTYRNAAQTAETNAETAQGLAEDARDDAQAAAALAATTVVTFANMTDPAVAGDGARLYITDERYGEVMCISDGTIWRRTTDGRPAQSAAINYYVDSVAGNDANAGTSSGAALASLDGVKTKVLALPSYRQQGLWIAFKDGSSYAEDPWTLAANHAGCRFTNYGATAGSVRPNFDCSEIIDNGDFSEDGTYAGKYNVTLTLVPQPIALAAICPRIWRDGVCLTWVASAALCDATEGTFYHAPCASNATSVTIMVNTGTDPTSDGAVYLAPTKYCAIDAYLAEGAEFVNLTGEQPLGSYGVFVGSRFGFNDNLHVEHGGTHCFFGRANSRWRKCKGENIYGASLGAETHFVGFEPSTIPEPAELWLEDCDAIQTENWNVPPVAITAISLGSPTTITAPGHQFTENQYVRLESIGGTVELNGYDYRVTGVVAGTSFNLVKYVPSTASEGTLNSTTFTAYTSGGVAKLAASQNSAIGFYNHTAGATFKRVTYKNCRSRGTNIPLSGANVEEIVVEDCLFRDFTNACVKTGARLLWLNSVAINQPLRAAAYLAQSDGVGSRFEFYGGRAKLDSTGHISLTHASASVVVRNFIAEGLRRLFNGNQANQSFSIDSLDDRINTNLSNFERYTQTNATGLSWFSDGNNFNSGATAFTIGGTTYANIAALRAAGYDLNSKA